MGVRVDVGFLIIHHSICFYVEFRYCSEAFDAAMRHISAGDSDVIVMKAIRFMFHLVEFTFSVNSENLKAAPSEKNDSIFFMVKC